MQKKSYHDLVLITNYKKNGRGESNLVSCHPLLWKYIWKDPGNDANCEYCFPWAKSYYKIQKQILFPVANQVYNDNRTEILSTLKSNKLELVVDGRSDSPGYNENTVLIQ